MRSEIIVILAIAAAVTVAWFTRRFWIKQKVKPIWGRVMAIRNRTSSPLGVQIWIEDGAECSLEARRAIERGLARTFAKSGCLGYPRTLTYGDAIVAIVKGEPDSQGNPAYRIPAGPYAGTIYDKGGYILVAGEVISVGDQIGNIIVIPEHRTNMAHLETVTEHEWEHVEYAWHDAERFEATKFHGVGEGHPIMPECPGTEYFASSAFDTLCCVNDAVTPVDRMIAEDGEVVMPKTFL